jgi:hypothetical protein
LTLLKKTKNKHQHFASDNLPDEVIEDSHAFADESLNQLYDAIRRLSEVDRGVILLYLEEKSYQEIAIIFDTNTNNIGVRIKRIKERLKKLLDEKSIETIWKEGFLKNDALVAPKLKDMYNQKSMHIIEKFKRMYRININAIIVFALFLLPVAYITNMPYMGIPMFFIFVFIIVFSLKFKKKLYSIESSQNSYQYLISFNDWIKEMVRFNTKMSRFLYPTVFLSMALGFWFGSIGGDIPGEEFISEILVDYPNMTILFGLPLFMIIGGIVLLFLLAFFGGKIGQWDLNLVYGRILRKLDELLVDMEELRI